LFFIIFFSSSTFPSAKHNQFDFTFAAVAFKERRIYSSDSLPTVISQRVFLQNIDEQGHLSAFLPEQRKMNYNSEGHFGPSLFAGYPSVMQNLKKLVKTISPASFASTIDQRKRLFYVIEAVSTEFVYVQVLDVIAAVRE
jgi:hypothetical protein